MHHAVADTVISVEYEAVRANIVEGHALASVDRDSHRVESVGNV